MNKVLIHLKESAQWTLKDQGLEYTQSDGELNVIVDDVPYTVTNGFYQDPDEQLCEHYGIDYEDVNCIEAA